MIPAISKVKTPTFLDLNDDFFRSSFGCDDEEGRTESNLCESTVLTLMSRVSRAIRRRRRRRRDMNNLVQLGGKEEEILERCNWVCVKMHERKGERIEVKKEGT